MTTYTVYKINNGNSIFENKDIETMLYNEQLYNFVGINITRNNDGTITDDINKTTNDFTKKYNVPCINIKSDMLINTESSTIKNKTYYSVK